MNCEAIRRTVSYAFCIRSSLFPVSCSLFRATNHSLEFILQPVYGRKAYRLVGHGLNTIVSGPVFTVTRLTYGSCYRFTLRDVPHGDYRETRSNPIRCGGCTVSRMLRFVLLLHLGNFWVFKCLAFIVITVDYLCPPHCNRAGHYSFVMWFPLSSSSFFPRLLSAVGIGCLPYFTHDVALVRI